jgi:branched-chain amino acid transport system substrate-binding protein
VGVRIATDFSYFAKDIGTPYFYGMYDYLRYLNTHGGVGGCTIDIDAQDNKYSPETMSQVVASWKTQPSWKQVTAAFIFGSPPISAVGADLQGEKKVIVAGTYAGSLASPKAIDQSVTYGILNDSFSAASYSAHKSSTGWPYVFFPATDHGTAARVAVYAVWNIAQGRIAFARDTSGMCPDCEEPVAAGAAQVASQNGMSIGRDLNLPQLPDPSYYDQAVKPGVTAYFDAEIKQVMSTAGKYDPVRWLWCGDGSVSCALLAKAVAEVQAKIDAATDIPNAATWKIRIIANNWGIGEETTQLCGDACAPDPKNSDPTTSPRFYGLFPVPRYGDLQNSTGMSLLQQIHDSLEATDLQNPPPAPIPARKAGDFKSVRYVQGYAAAMMWERGMLAAIEAGHPNPTGEDLKNALEGFKAVDLKGMTASPISFSASDHRPQSDEAIYAIVGSGANLQLQYKTKYSISTQPEWLGY